MTNPSMPQMPGAGAMTDTLEFMKNLWGNVKMPGVSIPGMVMPSLSVEEINKQITDLKAVESWLTVNMNMLHGTIKALEVQSATISTLQSMSANFSSAMQPPPAPPVEDAAPFHSPFAKPAAQATEPAPAPAPESIPESESEPERPANSSAAAQMPNPAVWWNMLQDQFKQAVAGAIPPAQKDTHKATSKAKPTTKAKPRSTKTSTATAKKPAAATKRAAPRKS
jgi:hypothetical protein